ncbi:MAG: Sec-independent protein translocase subunit TatA/TatB [Fimbriimonadaceae bacterium]
MGLLEPVHLLIIGLIVMIFFGPKKIPELMRGIGKGMGELQKGIADGKAALHSAMQDIQPEPIAEVTVPEKVTAAAQIEPAAPTDAKTVAKDDKPLKSA